MSALATILIVVATLYVFLLIFTWLHADEFVFQPPLSSYRKLPGLTTVAASDGTPLAVVHRVAPGAEFTLLFLHGNAEDLGDMAQRVEAFVAHGYSVVAFDFRGYGQTPGFATEANVHADTTAVFRHVVGTLGVPLARLVIYGRSLGGGPAVALAAREAVAGLVLEGGFKSAFRVVTGIGVLPGDRFCNVAKMKRVRCPVLVVHATSDRTVPFSHGEELFALSPEPKFHLWIEGAGHNDLVAVAGDRYWNALAQFAKSLMR